jgi:hypothetical protein
MTQSMYKTINIYNILAGKIQGKRDHLGGLDTDARIILKWVLEK